MGAKPYRKTVYERNQKQGGGHHTGAKLILIIRHTDLIRHKKIKHADNIARKK